MLRTGIIFVEDWFEMRLGGGVRYCRHGRGNIKNAISVSGNGQLITLQNRVGTEKIRVVKDVRV